MGEPIVLLALIRKRAEVSAEGSGQARPAAGGLAAVKGVTYEQLAEKLRDIGVTETPASIANKISRGRFTAVFLLQCLETVDRQTLEIR